MRIISGKYKGRTIPAPSNMKARPTTDFAKTALFNILENRFDFSALNVLDLYCGTGSIGFEFLSRGAATVTAVDQDFVSARFCNTFARELGYEKQYKAYKNDCIRALKQVVGPYQLIFCDPPYSYSDHARLHQAVFDAGILAPGGLLIIEHGQKTNLSAQPFFEEVRKYGNVFFSFFTRPNE